MDGFTHVRPFPIRKRIAESGGERCSGKRTLFWSLRQTLLISNNRDGRVFVGLAAALAASSACRAQDCSGPVRLGDRRGGHCQPSKNVWRRCADGGDHCCSLGTESVL